MSRGIDNRTTRKLLLGSASALALSVAFAQDVAAGPCGSGSDITIVAACTAPFDWTGGNLTIASLGTISGPSYGVGVASGSVGEFNNLGVVSASSMSYGLSLSAGASIGKLTNHGTIAGFSAAVYANGSIGTLTNTGLLDTPNSGIRTSATGVIGTILNQAGATINASWALYNFGHVGTFSNAGTLTPSRIGINNKAGGVIDVIENTGFINSTDRGIQSNGSIGSIYNSGTIVGSDNSGIGISNSPTGTIGTITNTGLIRGISPMGIRGAGIYAAGTITLISNSGTIEGNMAGVAVYLSPSRIETLINDGTIRSTGTQGGVDNYGTIDSLLNNGLITGPTYAVLNVGSMTLVNAGTIAGNIDNTGTLTISGGSGGTIGTLTGLNGSIGAFTGSALTFDIGALVLNDVIAQGVTVVGTGGSLTNTGSIGTIGGVSVGSLASLEAFTNSGEIAAPTAFDNAGSIGALTNLGTIQGVYGVLNSGTIDALDNQGAIHGLGGATSSAGIYNYGWITSLTNSGTINAPSAPLIQARTGIYNAGSITELTNTGLVSGANFGIYNSGNIDTITNSGRIIGGVTTAAAIYNAGTIGVLTNEGVVGNINNADSWTLISNAAAGTIHYIDNYVGGVLTELANGGVIEAGISNGGEITTLTNDGMIRGGTYVAIDNQGVIGALTNNGLITGTNALWNASGMTISVSNAGTIEGDISNYGSLTISGGSGGSVGTLTGFNGTMGTVQGSFDFGTGALLLNDVIVDGLQAVGAGGTLTNTGSISKAGLTVHAGATLALLTNNATMAGTNSAIHAFGRIDTMVNAGTVSGRTAIKVEAAGSVGLLSNTGSISTSVFGINNAGRIDTIDNSGTMTTNGVVIRNVGSNGIGAIVNRGTILGTGGTAVGIFDDGGTISSISNLAGAVIDGNSSSAAPGSGAGIAFANTITTLSNYGTIRGSNAGIYAQTALQSQIDTLINAGTIIGGKIGIDNGGGIIGELTNSGLITGSIYAINNSGAISIVNSGTIAGDIYNSGTLTISGGSNGTVGTLTGLNGGMGTISGGLDFNDGVLLFNDIGHSGINVVGTDGTLINTGAIEGMAGLEVNAGASLAEFSNKGSVYGVGGLANNGSIGALRNAMGGTINGSAFGMINNDSFGTLANDGLISSEGSAFGPSTPAAILNNGTIEALTNSGKITGLSGAMAITNFGAIGTIGNTGVISGDIASTSALTFAGGTTTGTLTGGTITAPSVNFISGTHVLADDIVGNTSITGARVNVAAGVDFGGDYTQTAGVLDISAYGGILTITGTAHITGGTVIAGNLSPTENYLAGDTAGTLIDAASGSSYSGLQVQFGGISELVAGPDTSSTDDLRIVYLNDYIGGNLPTLGNTGSIGGADYGVFIAPGGSIGTFSNSGTIGGSQDAFSNSGTIGLLQNDGIISDGSGVDNSGLILVLTNNGLIEGDSGIHNTGTIGSLINAGTITGPDYAIDNAGSLGPISNSGTIHGNIRSTSALAISGGTGSTFGVLSGGIITADVDFTSGNLRLSDAIVGQATNSGAVLQLASAVSITGSYTQTAGTLDFGSNRLAVSGTARFTGGTINAALSATGNYLAGHDVVLIDAAAGSSYAGATLNLNAITGLSAAATTASTEDLAITFGNDYIGGSLASLNNTGTLSGAAYGVYVASTGNLGALANSSTIRGTQYAIYSAGTLGTITNTGLISGNIRSAGVLMLAGSGGTLSGGTITATGVSIAGSLKLADTINVGSGTVSAGTASVELSSKISITGNYLQTGGVLISDVTDTTTYGALAVSGGATITNTTITLNGSSLSAGQTYTIVDAGAASSYTGDTLTVLGAHYKAQLDTSGNDLIASIKAMFIDIGKTKGGPAAVMGAVYDDLSNVTAMRSSIDALSLLSDEDLGKALNQAAPAGVGSGAAMLQRAGLVADQIGMALDARRGGAHWSLWAQVMGGSAARDAVSGAAGYDTSVLGMLVGADGLAADDLLLGGALGWSTGWNGGRSDVSGSTNGMTGLQLAGYANWTPGSFTLRAQAQAGFNRYKQHREMSYLQKVATASYAGQQYVLDLDGGYDLALTDKLTLTPNVSMRWLRLATDGYTETGGGADNLTVGSWTADQVEGGLGAKLAWSADTTLGVVRPEITVSWLHDFTEGAIDTNAVLGGLAFKTSSARIAADAIRIGTGVSLHLSDAMSLRLEYGGQFRKDYAAHGGMLQLAMGL